MKIIFLFLIFTSGIASSQADEMPFYFFRFEPNQYPELFKSNAEAQKELCKITEKNCTLESAEEFPKYAILPLYEKPDLKSNVAGAFVNAQSKGQTSLGHFKESALASFVINKSGIKKGIVHYVSYNSEWVKTWLENGDFTGVIAFDVGELHAKGFFAYVRADKAIPNTSESYVVRVNDGFDPKEKFDERWYGLANPDESGGVLWLRYKSDLRSPQFASLDLSVNFSKSAIREISQVFGTSKDNQVNSIYLCRMLNENEVTLIHAFSYDYLTDLEEKRKKLIMRKNQELPQSKNRDVCLSKSPKLSKYEYIIPLDKVYKNGFLEPGVGISMIELKEYVEYQEVWPLLIEFEELSELKQKSKSIEKESSKKPLPAIFLKKPSMIQD